MTEAEIQNEILHWLNSHDNIFAWKQDNKGTYDPRTGKFRALKGFSIRGVSDIIGVIKPSGRLIALEVKRPETIENTSKFQEAFINKIKKMGGVAGVVSSVSDVRGVFCDNGLDWERKKA